MSEPLSPNPESQLHLTRRWEYCLLLLVLILGAFLRIYRLPTIPPGLTHDEADFSHDGIAVYHGARPLYVATYGYQDEPLMHYASAMMMVLMGPSYLAVRATSALFGVLLILLDSWLLERNAKKREKENMIIAAPDTNSEHEKRI